MFGSSSSSWIMFWLLGEEQVTAQQEDKRRQVWHAALALNPEVLATCTRFLAMKMETTAEIAAAFWRLNRQNLIILASYG